MSRAFEGAQGNRLVASEMGVGRPVLLLHGGGQTRHAWSRTARRLAEAGWHAVALDQRGHGDSAWVADGAYAFPDFAADAAAVARQIAREQGQVPVSIGASLGGIASLLALREPGEPVFAGLILVDVVPKMNPRGSITFRASCATAPTTASPRSRRPPRLSPPICRTVEAGLARRTEEKSSARLERPLALALGSAVSRRFALGE